MSDTIFEATSAAPADTGTITLAATAAELEGDIRKVHGQLKRLWSVVIATALLTVAIGASSFLPRALGGPGAGFAPPAGANGSAPASATAIPGQ